MNVKSLEYYGRIKERTLEVLKFVETEDEKYLENVEQMTQNLYTMTPPILLDGSQGSYIMQLEKEQSQLYFAIEEMGISNPEGLSLLKFYSLIDKKEAENLKKQQNARKHG